MSPLHAETSILPRDILYIHTVLRMAMALPPFAPPTLAELREWYRLYQDNTDVWRLILEVQHSRELLAHLDWSLKKIARVAERAEFGGSRVRMHRCERLAP